MTSTDSTGALTRRRFIGASAGAAGVLALRGLNPLVARAGGPLFPPGKRSIILFTVRDRISAAPDSSGGDRLIDFTTFFSNLGARGAHYPIYEQDNAPGGSANPGRSLDFAAPSYAAMDALRA